MQIDPPRPAVSAFICATPNFSLFFTFFFFLPIRVWFSVTGHKYKKIKRREVHEIPCPRDLAVHACELSTYIV